MIQKSHLSIRWNDGRYAWDPSSYEGLTSVPLPFSKSWAPDLVLVNSAEDKFVFRQVGIVKYNGDIVYVVAVHTKSLCAPKRQFYCIISISYNMMHIAQDV